MTLEENIRSEEVEDIMERMPKRFIKWGSGVLLMLILILILLAAIIQYPDVISGNALITTKNPPSHISYKGTGIIQAIFVRNNDRVVANQPLAIVSKDNYKAVFWMDSIISQPISGIKSGANTGNSNSQPLYDYSFWSANSREYQNIEELTYAISNYLRTLKEYYLLSENKGTLEEACLQTAKKDVYTKSWAVVTQREGLKLSIANWKDKYLIRSPTKGIVSFTNYWAPGQEIKMDQEFAAIIPEDKNIICKVVIPVAGSSKVKATQKTRIILANFPENEFGFVEGRVVSISSIPIVTPMSSNYIVNVSVPSPLVSSINREIGYMPDMQATVEIITEKKTILSRLTENWLRYWKKNV